MAQLAPRIGAGAGWVRAVGGRCAARGGAVVVCPDPVVVYRPIAGALTGVQHGGGVAAGRAPGCRGVGCRAGDVVGRHESLRTLFAAPEGIPQQLVVPAERADFGWQVVDASGWSQSRLGEALEDAGSPSRLIWRPRSLCGHSFSASPTTSMCWWPWCTISPPTAGRSPRWCVIWGWLMPARCAGRPRSGRRWRCSMSITRCGSARSSVIWPTPTAASPRSWATGSRCPGRAARAAAAAHRSALSAGGRSARGQCGVDWPAELQQQVAAGGPRA